MKYQKLGQHILQIRGISYKPEDVIAEQLDGYVPVIKSNNIKEEGFDSEGVIYVKSDYIRPEQFIRKGDLVLTASSGSKKTIGKNIQFDNNYNGSFGAFCKLIRPKLTINPKFLYHFFKTRFFRDSIEKAVQGANISNLKNEYIDDLEIPLPSLDDQIRIAAVLTRAEKLIAKRKESIKALDELLKSTFLEMFGDPVRNEQGWEKIVFESVVKDFRNGQSPVTSGNIKGKVYTLSAITGNSFKGNEYKISSFESINDNSIVKNDDFLICRGNGNIKLVGRCVVVKDISDKIIFPDTMICANIDITKINKKFIEVMWKLSFIRGQIEQFARTTNGTYKINQQSLKNMMIIVPPIQLQNQFAAIVEKVEALKSKYINSLTELENLYGSLSQRAFKGELDLSGVPVCQTAFVWLIYLMETGVLQKLSSVCYIFILPNTEINELKNV